MIEHLKDLFRAVAISISFGSKLETEATRWHTTTCQTLFKSCSRLDSSSRDEIPHGRFGSLRNSAANACSGLTAFTSTEEVGNDEVHLKLFLA
jgi:hypothetical protein